MMSAWENFDINLELQKTRTNLKPLVSIFADQHEFMKAAGNEYPAANTANLATLAEELVIEEAAEFLMEDDFNNKIKEAIDLIYVTAQWLNTVIGPESAERVWRIVHANNMSKLTDGVLVKREDGKILKPKGYKPVDLSGLRL